MGERVQGDVTRLGIDGQRVVRADLEAAQATRQQRQSAAQRVVDLQRANTERVEQVQRLGRQADAVVYRTAALAQQICLGRQTAGFGECALAHRLIALPYRDDGGRRGGDREHHQRRDGGTRQAADASELAHVVAVEFVLAAPVQRRRDVEDGEAEPGVAQRHRLGGFRPAQVYPQRLGSKTTRQEVCRQRVGTPPIEVAGRFVPDQIAIGEQDQQLGQRAVAEPPVDLALHPARSGGRR
jgi:hypothetical protein